MSSMFTAFIAMVLMPIFTRADVSHLYLPAQPSAKGSSNTAWNGPLAMPKVLSDGTIAETVEVAAARAAHLAALEAARALDPDMGQDDGQYDPQKYGDHAHLVVDHRQDILQTIAPYQATTKPSRPASVYGAPVSSVRNAIKTTSDSSAKGAIYGAPAIGSEGRRFDVISTTYGAPSQTEVGSGYGYSDKKNMPYSGPLAMLQLLASGYLEDTPEVVAARTIHLKALKEAQTVEDLWRSKLTDAGRTRTQSEAHPWG